MSDEFGNFIEDRTERKSKSKFRKTEFVSLDEGEHVIRILDRHEEKFYTHYIGWVYAKCLGEECPICQNNRKILYEHPEDYRDVKGWNPRRDRYYINVLDRTPVKVCEKCETENTTTSEVCASCGTVLGLAKPADKVKVLSGSSKLFEDLKVISNSVRDDEDKRVDIRTYDWQLLVRGKGRDKAITPRDRYNPAKAGLIEVPAEQLFNLNEAVISLSAEEMLDLWNGASLKDIFTVRRAKKQVVNSSEVELTDQLNKDMEDAVSLIFKQ